MDVLSQIISKKRERVAQAKQRTPLERLRIEAIDTGGLRKPHALRGALQNDGINIIAEFKRRSPSKGVIRENADLYSIVKSYKAGGAVALSILTEEDYFDGSLADLRQAKEFFDLHNKQDEKKDTDFFFVNSYKKLEKIYYDELMYVEEKKK